MGANSSKPQMITWVRPEEKPMIHYGPRNDTSEKIMRVRPEPQPRFHHDNMNPSANVSKSKQGFQNYSNDMAWLWGSLFLFAIVFALSPGILFTFPKGGSKYTVTVVHALLIVLVFNFI